MSTIISYPDRTLLAPAISTTGVAFQAAHPLGNLQNDQLKLKARSANALAANTKVRVDLGAYGYLTRCIAILSHNISFAGTVRARGYSDSGYSTLVTGADTGTQYAYPQTLTATQAAKYPDHWIYCLSASVNARYWEIEIVDTANANGWVEFGRLWLGEATLAPAVSIAYNATLGYKNRDIVSESAGGAKWGQKRKASRIIAGTFENLTGLEKQAALIMQDELGLLGELLFVMNSDDTAIDMLTQAFPATMNKIDPLKYPYFGATSASVEFVEILNTSNVRYSMGGSPTDVLGRE